MQLVNSVESRDAESFLSELPQSGSETAPDAARLPWR
jgi:hypothetical protein